MYTASDTFIDALKSEEGFSPTAYPDASGYSIGYGTFLDTTAEQNAFMHATIDKEQGDALLRRDVQSRLDQIQARIHVPLNQNQVDALVGLTYNTGMAPLTTGSLDDLINNNAGEAAIRAKWLQYHFTGGQPSDQLLARRQREVDLYYTPPGSLTPQSKKKS